MLEESIKDLAAAVRELAAAVKAGSVAAPAAPAKAPAKATKEAAPAAPAAPATPATPAPATGGHTVESLRDGLKGVLETKGKDAVVSALAAVGATKLSEVKPELFAKLAEAIAAATAAAADPFA